MPHKLTNMLSRVPSDIDIAQAATPIPIDQIAAGSGHSPGRTRALRQEQGKGAPRHSRPPEEQSQREIRRDHRNHSHAARGRENHHDRRPEPGARRASRQESLHLHSPAEPGTHVRHQGRRGRRRIQPDHPDGGVQSPSHGRYSRHHRREQPRRRRDRCALVPRKHAEARRLVRPSLPARERRQPPLFARHAAPLEKARNHQNQSRRPHARRAPPLRASRYRREQHHVAPRDRYERPHAPPDHHRARARGKGHDARHGLRHLGRQRNHGDPRAHHEPCRHARAPRRDGHRHQQGRRTRSRRTISASAARSPS